MKKLVLIYLLLFSGFIFSQNNEINKLEIIPKEIDFTGCVKKITIKNFYLNNKIDTVKTISEIDFSKNRNILLLKNYANSLNDLWRIVEFDNLERIKSISKKNGNEMTNFVNQYFSKKNEFPDSTIINKYQNYKEKYINNFNKNLLAKHEYYVNDSLRDYRVYKYNNQNQIIEDLYCCLYFIKPDFKDKSTELSKKYSPKVVHKSFLKKHKKDIVGIDFFKKYGIKKSTYEAFSVNSIIYIVDCDEQKKGKITLYRVLMSSSYRMGE